FHSEHKLGSIEDILNRSTSSTWSSSRIRSIKHSSFFVLVPPPESCRVVRISVPFPKSPRFTPVRTISLTPDRPISLALLSTCSMALLRLFPRACGIVQNEQL